VVNSAGTGARLPIFDSVESDWFRRGGVSISAGSGNATPSAPAAPESWSSPADDGFRAANAAASPATGAVTMAGLPKRVPSANLVPGKVGRDQAPAAATRRPAAPVSRSEEDVRRAADEVRNRMSGLQRGGREGRAAAPVNLESDEN
jgi:hypothetical protein